MPDMTDTRRFVIIQRMASRFAVRSAEKIGQGKRSTVRLAAALRETGRARHRCCRPHVVLAIDPVDVVAGATRFSASIAADGGAFRQRDSR
ncbi:hypothetical protein [Burkholderia glumae]|uniref:hypothetical protein n=1 Tax=Burkholderia glumae TaxID=337 RepID=UPI00157A5FA4|nr:hypothetical protein [Burkholderia glumae]